MTFATNLHRAAGLGSAKKGPLHWIAQRVTAVALIPLGLWFVGAFLVLLFAPFEQAQLWLSSLWVVTGVSMFVLVLFYHGCLGMQMIWEDYIPHETTRWALILGTKFLSAFLALLSLVSILKVYVSA